LLGAHAGRIALGCVSVLVRTGVALAVPYLVKVGIDRGVVARDGAVLTVVTAVVLGLALVQAGAARVEVLTVARVGQRTLYAAREKLFTHLQRLSLDYYQRERTGGVVAHMVGDVDAMGGLVSDGLVGLAASGVTLVGVATVLVLLDWRLAVAALVVTPLLAVATTWFRRRSAHAWRRLRRTTSAVTVALQETITGVRVVQAFRREAATAAGFATVNDDQRGAGRRTVTLAAVYFPGVEFVSVIATAVVVGFGAPRVVGGSLAIGTFTAFLLYLRILFDPVFRLSELYDTVQAARAGAERIGAVLDTRPTVTEPLSPIPLPAPRGEIRLAGLGFAYPGRDGGPGRAVLHDALGRLRQNRTTVLVAHRLSSVLGADTVAVIVDGRVVEAGPPVELLAVGGHFRALFDRWIAVEPPQRVAARAPVPLPASTT
jgi:ABC-type multidrug transport system fused ATPase/permease subunit